MVLTAALMSVSLVAAASVYVGLVNHNIQRADLLITRADVIPSTGRALDFILVGSTRGAGVSLSSTHRIIVLHLSKNRRSAALISFPVNTYVTVPGRGRATIGSAYAWGGAKLTDQTIEKLLGTPMDHIVVTNLDGYQKLAQQGGPITVRNPTAYTNLGYTFAQGDITLDGPKALAYVRQRSGDRPGEQAARQQLVTEAGIKKQLHASVLRQPRRLSFLIRTASKNTTVDQGLTAAEILKITLSLRLTASSVRVVHVPLLARPYVVHGQTVRTLDPTTFAELAQAVKTDRVDDYLQTHPNP